MCESGAEYHPGVAGKSGCGKGKLDIVRHSRSISGLFGRIAADGTLGISITDVGETVIDDQAKKIHCATGWKDLAGFEDLLVKRVIGAG